MCGPARVSVAPGLAGRRSLWRAPRPVPVPAPARLQVPSGEELRTAAVRPAVCCSSPG